MRFSPWSFLWFAACLFGLVFAAPVRSTEVVPLVFVNAVRLGALPCGKYTASATLISGGAEVVSETVWFRVIPPPANRARAEIRNGVLYVGGGVHLNLSSLVQNCTVYGNRVTNSTGTSSGGMLTHAGSSIQNTIPYANKALSNAEWSGGIYGNCCSSVTNGMMGGGNLAANPLVRDPAGGDCRLNGASPCVDAGLNGAWMEPATDLDGRSRLDRYSGIVDIGAYEFVSFGTMIKMQ